MLDERLIDSLEAAALAGQVSWTAVADTLDAVEAGPAAWPKPDPDPRFLVGAQHALARVPSRQERERLVPFVGREVVLHGLMCAFGLVNIQGNIPGRPEGEDWWKGASPAEVLAFDLYPGMAEGADLPGASEEVLTARMQVARERLADDRTRTRWLEGYASQLLDERRRRRGVAA